jgi:hypothetical protein
MSIPSYMTDLAGLLGLSSTYESEFRSYLKLADNQGIPDNSVTEELYLKFLSSQTSLASYIIAAIQQNYGSTEDIDELALLDEFRASLGLSASDPLPDTDDTRRQFVYFLKSPLTLAAQALFGISTEAADSIRAFRQQNAGSPIGDSDTTLDAYMTFLASGTTPTTNILTFIKDALSAFNNTDVTNSILTKFRAYLGVLGTEALSNDTSTKAAFLSFMKEALATVQKSEAVNAISPQEQETRNILFSTFSIILKMMNVLQKASQVESKSQQIYADWMSSITNQISATPLYGPTALNTIIANDDDFGKTTLGYGSITVRDVLNYLMNQIQTNGTSSSSFTVRNPNYQNLTAYPNSGETGFPRFELVKNSDGSYTFKVESPTTYNADQTVSGWTTLLQSTMSPTSTVLNQSALNAVVDGLLSKMTESWDSASSIVTPQLVYWTPLRDSDGNLIPGEYLSRIINLDLKAAWSAEGVDMMQYYTPDLSTKGWRSLYYSWSSGYILSSGSLYNRDDNFADVVNGILNTMATNGNDAYYYSVGWIHDGIVGHNAYFTLEVVKDSSTPDSAHFTVYWRRTGDAYNGPGAADTSWDKGTDFTSSIQKVSQSSGLWGPWESAWPQTVTYPSGFEKASLQAIESNAQTYRGEVNAQLQLYLQSTQARQSTVETAMKNMQNLVSQTTQAVTNMTNLLDNIIQTFTSILSALFH